MSVVIPQEVIEQKIYLIRGKKVMLDKDLAQLYGVPTKRLKEQVRRNPRRFPNDFMFELTWEEAETLASRSHFATLKKGKNIKYLPYVFTEQGIAMLARKLEELERKYDAQFKVVFDAIRQIVAPPDPPKRKIGFHAY